MKNTLAVLVVMVLALAACSDDDGDEADDDTTTVESRSTTTEPAGTSSSAPDATTGAPTAARPATAADARDLIAAAGFVCDPFSWGGTETAIMVSYLGGCQVTSTVATGGTEDADIHIYADQQEMDDALAPLRDVGIGVSIVACDRWTVDLANAETAQALADALGCRTLI